MSFDINSNISLGNAETDIFGEFQTANNRSAARTRNAILSLSTTEMILNTGSNDGDDYNCFKIIFVSSIVLVLHLSGVISVKRLSPLSQLYHPRTGDTSEWHFS